MATITKPVLLAVQSIDVHPDELVVDLCSGRCEITH